MSAAETREEAELAFAARPNYADPTKLAARMAFWDMGFKRDPRCSAQPVTKPEDATSCECAKAGTNTAIFCARNDGAKCIMTTPLVGTAGWTDADIEEKNLSGCSANFPAKAAADSTLIGAAIVDSSHSNLLITGLAFLLLLSVWGHLRHGR